MKAKSSAVVLMLLLLAVRATVQADNAWRSFRKDAAEIWGMGMASGASRELNDSLHCPASEQLRSSSNDDNYFKYYPGLSDDQKTIFTLMHFSCRTLGGDTSMLLLSATSPDRFMITHRLNHANPEDLTHFCQFSGAEPNDFVPHLNHFFVVNLKLPKNNSIYRADFSNTYIDEHLATSDKQAFLIYGLGMGHGYVYWLNRAITGKTSSAGMITLDLYFQRQLGVLGSEDQACLAILILASPAYNHRQEPDLRDLLKSNASRIDAKMRGLSETSVKEYCRWIQISESQWLENVNDVRKSQRH